MLRVLSRTAPRTVGAAVPSGKRNLSTQKEPVRIAITGPAGAIGYSMLYRIAAGGLFGPDQPVIFHLLELPGAMNALKGTCMEIDDCAFPLVKGIVQTDNADKAFDGIDYAFLVGAKPRGPGMERADLLKDNGGIFTAIGKSLNKFAKKTVRVLIVGNPANTNTLICSTNAPDIPRENFSAMMRLDHNRAISQLATKTGAAVENITQLAVWGNHSPTQYPDISHCLINGKPAKEVIGDDKWVVEKFMPDVQKRGAAIIDARGASSAASAGSSAIDHMRDWVQGSNGQWVSMGAPTDGSYGIEEGLFFGFPYVIDAAGNAKRVEGLAIDEFSQQCLDKTKKELLEERDAVKELL